MAGRIESVDIALQTRAIVTQSPLSPAEVIQEELSKLVDDGPPALPGAAAAETGSEQPPFEESPLISISAALAPEAVLARFGIGNVFDVTDRVSAATRVTEQANLRTHEAADDDVTAQATEQAPRAAAGETIAIAAIDEKPANINPEAGPDAQSGRAVRLGSLASLGVISPRGPIPAALAMATPRLVESLTGGARAGVWTFSGSLSGRLARESAPRRPPPIAEEAPPDDRDRGIGRHLHSAA